MKELYTKEVMAYAANIPHIGVLADADGAGEAHSKLCGSRIRVGVRLEEGRVSAFAQEVKACLVGQASASMLGGLVIGLRRAQIEAARRQVAQMLKEEGEPPEGPWTDYALLSPVRNYPSRIPTVLLAFDAVLRAMDDADARAQGEAHQASK